MLNIDVDTGRNVVTARPVGAIPASDFEALGRAIDDYANENDRMPGLVVRLNGLPQWQGLSALRAHFDVVRKHAAVLPRVALVTDTMGLSMLPNIADIFVRARVRHFDVSQEEQAIAWAGSSEKEPEGYVLLEGFPEEVIAIRAVGEVTSRDYEDRLIPLVRKMERKHGKLRLLMQLGPDFETYTTGAMWDDARLGLTHWRSFEKVAVVSDIGWITRSVEMFAPLMPGEVAVFPGDAMQAATSWITEGAGSAKPEKSESGKTAQDSAAPGKSSTRSQRATRPDAAKSAAAKAAAGSTGKTASARPAAGRKAAASRTAAKKAVAKPGSAKPLASDSASGKAGASSGATNGKAATKKRGSAARPARKPAAPSRPKA